MDLKSTLRRAGSTLHSVFARTPRGAGLYLELWSGVLRAVPDNQVKTRLVNSLRTTSWPDIELRPRLVRLGAQVEVKLTPHVQEFDFDVLFYKHLPYERAVFALLEGRASTYDAVIEIGANVGVFTLFFTQLLAAQRPAAQIYAFEPSFDAFFRLQQNIRLNAVMNVQLFNCAIGDHVGFTQFYEPVGHLTNGSLYADFASTFADHVKTREVLLLDGQVVATLMRDCRSPLIKIDVEGAESLVLQSMRDFIEMRTPEIVLEVLEVAVDELNALIFLRERYDLYNITLEGLVAQPAFTATRDRDYLLVPKRK